MYRGTVLKHLNAGRLKVYVYGVYPPEYNEQPDFLPVCEQAMPLFAGCNNGNGMFSYPNIGSTVWCFFQNGDSNFPVAIAATLGGTDAILQYTVSRPKVTAKDVAEGTDAYVHHIKCGNSRVTIWEPGRIEIVTEEDDAATNTSKIEIDGKGNIKMSSTTQVQIMAPVILLSASSKIEMVAPNQTSINSVCNTVLAPAINLDANTERKPSGNITLKGKKHCNMVY